MDKLQSRNNTIDIIRFFTCPFILLIHCPLPGALGDAIIQIGRYGVPFFLLLSGWFSYASDTQEMIFRAKKKLADTVKLLGSFVVAYVIMNSASAVLSEEHILSWVWPHANIKSLVYLVLFNRAVFLGSTGCYPLMLIYVYAIFLLLARYNLLKKAIPAVPGLLMVNVLLGAFTELPWFCYGNFLFTGLPFFLMGHWLHKHYERLPKTPSVWLCVLGAGVLLSLAEACLNRPAYCSVGSICMAVALLLFAVNHNKKVANQRVIRALQRYSVYIFVVHCGVRDMILAFLDRQKSSCSEYTLAIMVLLFSLVICVVWDYLSACKKSLHE